MKRIQYNVLVQFSSGYTVSAKVDNPRNIQKTVIDLYLMNNETIVLIGVEREERELQETYTIAEAFRRMTSEDFAKVYTSEQKIALLKRKNGAEPTQRWDAIIVPPSVMEWTLIEGAMGDSYYPPGTTWRLAPAKESAPDVRYSDPLLHEDAEVWGKDADPIADMRAVLSSACSSCQGDVATCRTIPIEECAVAKPKELT